MNNQSVAEVDLSKYFNVVPGRENMIYYISHCFIYCLTTIILAG